ncbi:MAG TPA: bifunctional serine/threonine-protein kinase/universal stress protein [Usitatibacter sp.]|nr:bifunctional serine/threonine-protein kinase/universal stress protein [Usitatibacter sp.]
MAATMEVAPGRVIDGFELGPCVHEGAMGRLFEVSRPGASFPMLMKVPRMGLVDSAELMLGFETEAMILPRLHGPHVPRFVAAGSVTTVPYLVTERIAGASLEGRVGAPLPADEVARIGAAIADALHSVHAQDVIHFDIKPDNVLLRPDGRAVLVDFALAHHRHLPDLVSQERRYTAGSAPYISPEQVRGVRTDPRSDLFALGVLLYELATARLPFGVPATYGGMRDRLWIDPPPPRSATLAVPDWLQEVILRCLETEAARRYQTAALVAFDLRNPQQVALTERGERRHRAGALAQAARWWRARTLGVLPGGGAKEEPGAAPVVMVAVDTSHPDDPRQPELQRVTRRILSLSPEFRLICVSVVTSGLGIPDPRAADVQVEHRIRLRHWIGPLDVEPDRVSMHVLEAPDPSAALVEFAVRNNVDLIVLGAPAPDERTFAWWRSVASAVTANAPCSVHVVRRSGEPPA